MMGSLYWTLDEARVACGRSRPDEDGRGGPSCYGRAELSSNEGPMRETKPIPSFMPVV